MKLFIFVEGIWDTKFFKELINKDLCKKFDEIECIEFIENKNKERDEIKRVVKRNSSSERYIFCPDLDAIFAQSKVNKKIKEIADNYLKIEIEKVQNNAFIIVQKIESWYLAGFKQEFCNNYKPKKIEFIKDTEEVAKGKFNEIAKNLNITPDQLKKALISNRNSYNITEAKTRNKSFEIFCNAIGI